MQPTDSDPIQPTIPMVIPRQETGNLSVVGGESAGRWTVTLVAGVVAGLVAWLGGEACLNRIKPPRHAVNSKGLVLNLTDRREVSIADAKNAGLAFAFLGTSLGVGLGVAGGLTRRSGRAATAAALLGLIVGAAAGAGMSLALLPPYNGYKAQHPDEASRDVILPLLVHAGIWSAVGASGGLAFGFGLGARRVLPRIVLGGIAGAALGTIVYELIGAVAFPAAQTTQFVSATGPTRLFARLAVTLLAAAGVAVAASEPDNRPGQRRLEAARSQADSVRVPAP
jgi:MFS family permease